MANMTALELKFYNALVPYDKARKGEGYRIATRKWVVYYKHISDGLTSRGSGSHIETVYLHPSKPALLVKQLEDGTVSAWEAVA